MLCGKCGAEVGEDFKFCPECGTPMPVVRKTAEKILDKGKEAVDKVKTEVEETVTEAKDKAAEAAEKVKSEVEETVSEAKDKVADAAEKVKSEVEETVTEAKDKATDAAKKAKDAVADKAEDVKASLEDESEKVKKDVKEIEENAKRAVKEETERMSKNDMENPVKAKEEIEIAEEEAKQKLKVKTFIWCMAVLACAVLITMMAQANQKTTVELDDFVSIAYEGFDTEGTAKAVFDKKGFENGYGEAIGDISGLINDCIDGKLSQTSGLSNGDKVTYEWDCDDAKAAEYKVILNYSDIEDTVSGLEELPDTTGMVFPESDASRLTNADIEDMDIDELKSALNEIYARHGYIFHNDETQKQFEEYSWYEPKIDPDDWENEDELNRIELYNVEFLKNAIKELKEAAK